MSAGQKIPFVLTHGASHPPPPKRAEAAFERLLGLRNDVGLLSEEYDTDTGRQLGNAPQAFGMVGLVNTAREHLPGKS